VGNNWMDGDYVGFSSMKSIYVEDVSWKDGFNITGFCKNWPDGGNIYGNTDAATSWITGGISSWTAVTISYE